MYCRGAIRALEPGHSCYIVCYKCSHVILLFQTNKPDDDDDDVGSEPRVYKPQCASETESLLKGLGGQVLEPGSFLGFRC